jgi:hypothetical protein
LIIVSLEIFFKNNCIYDKKFKTFPRLQNFVQEENRDALGVYAHKTMKNSHPHRLYAPRRRSLGKCEPTNHQHTMRD